MMKTRCLNKHLAYAVISKEAVICMIWSYCMDPFPITYNAVKEGSE